MARRHICILVGSLLVVSGLAGCSVGPVDFDDFLAAPSVAEARDARRAELEPMLDESALKEPGTLTVGLPVSAGAPLSGSLDEGGRFGISVDTAYALADELGISSVEFVSVGDVDDALRDECDIVMGVEPEESSTAVVLGSFAQKATGVFARDDVSAPIDASSISGKNVGVQEGSVSAVVLDDYELAVVRTPFPNLNEAFEALKAGEVDYVVCDAYAGAYLAAAYTGIEFAGTLDEPTDIGVAVSGSEVTSAVRAALETISTNGVGDIARASWVGGLPTLSTEVVVTGLVERVEETAPEDEEVGEDPAAEGDPDGSEGDSAAAEGTSLEGDSQGEGTSAE